MTVILSFTLVLTRSGSAPALLTALSMSECLLMKLSPASSSSLLLAAHEPGRGEGGLGTGSQLALAPAWPLKGPSSKEWRMSLSRKEQTALPAMALSGVVNTP